MFGLLLPEAMKSNDKIIVLSSDMSTPAGLDKFKASYSENFVNMGIAEQNMIGFAAGLSSEGYKTICVAQSCFITMRDFEQVRQYMGYMKSKQILVGIGSGLSLMFMGNTHYAIEDIALMRMIPGMTVTAPCDSLEAVKLLEAALTYDGSVYIRLFGGTGLPIVHADNINLEIGKAIKLLDGRDIEIIATGSMVRNALDVAGKLEADGISTSVVDMHTIKPLDKMAVDFNKKLIVTIEEHSVIGGLGSVVADYISEEKEAPLLLKIGVNDTFSPVGDYGFLLEQNGLSVDKIYSKVKEKYLIM